jgi:hypothetical protein
LILHGVGRRLPWFSGGADSGFVSVTTMHRRLFSPAQGSQTGLLHVSARRRGGVPAFRLSRPRYNAQRRTVSYRAGLLRRRAAAASQRPLRPFGRATLAILPRRVGLPGGVPCSGTLVNTTPDGIQFVSASSWDTDTWAPGSPPSPGTLIGHDDSATWESDGGFWRGCSNTLVWRVAFGDPAYAATLTITVSQAWNALAPTSTCTSSNPRVTCLDQGRQGTSNLWLVTL